MSELAPASFRLLLDRVVESAKVHFRHVFLPTALPLAVCGVLATMFQIGWIKTLMGDDLGEAVPMAASMFLIMIIIMVVYALAFGALFVASMDAVAGRPVSFARAWRFVIEPSVFGTLIVVTILCFLSLIMCVVPAFYAMPILAYTLAVMVEEDRYGWAAIRRSAEIAHHNPTGRWTDSGWLQTLVLLIVGLIISYAVGFTVQTPFLIMQQLMVFRDAASGQITDPATLMAKTLWLQAPAQVLGSFATAATWLYWTFGISLLYREIRRRKEGDDLQQAVDQLIGASDSENATPFPVGR